MDHCTICGLDCSSCSGKNECKGCLLTKGRPFGEDCMVAKCCLSKGQKSCLECQGKCSLRQKILEEINALHIPGMKEVTTLYALKGGFVNLEYTLPSGQKIKFWNDNKIYLGNQIEIENSHRCFGLTIDENYILVCEYGENGIDPEIITYQRRG